MDIRASVLVNTITDKIAKEKMVVYTNGVNRVNEGGGVSTQYFVHLSDPNSNPDSVRHLGYNAVYAYKLGTGFFCNYEVWYEGIKLDVSNTFARRLFKTMEQLFKGQERVKAQSKIDKLEACVNFRPSKQPTLEPQAPCN